VARFTDSGYKNDVAFEPADVGLLGANGRVFEAVKQSFGALGHDNSFGTSVFAQGAGLWYNTIRD